MEVLTYIKRVKSKQDERIVMIELTTSGKAIKKSAQSIPAQLFCSTGLSKDELIELQVTLDALLGNVKQHM
jgi:DNA-binding MarR family transcriptional regulator